MSNSLKNDLILLKELQDLDFQIIDAQKRVDTVSDTHNFLKGRVEACNFILNEIERMNVEDKITVDNIKNLVREQNFSCEDFLNDDDSVEVCVDKIEQLKHKFEDRVSENEIVVKNASEDFAQIVSAINSKRKGVVSILQPNFVKIYDRLFNAFEDKVVVTTIEDNTCAHCHVKCCMQKTIDVLKFENIVYCENCGRILFID